MLFKECGQILDINMEVYEDSGRTKGNCYILFDKESSANKCIKMNKMSMGDRW